MASIMHDAAWPLIGDPECPRILGLTTSFSSGSLQNSKQKRQQLETVLQASVFSPSIQNVVDKRWHRVMYDTYDRALAAQQVLGLQCSGYGTWAEVCQHSIRSGNP